MPDFTLNTYKILLDTIKSEGYTRYTVEKYLEKQGNNCIIFRHDVDRLPINSLILAQIENSKGIEATYYFRAIHYYPKNSLISRKNPGLEIRKVIQNIKMLGHEIGYHYEDLSACNGNMQNAWDSFRRNLDELRKIDSISTVCMHGSPLSRWDSRRLWDKYDYRTLGIVCEPYFDIDYSKVVYLTDTGRRWDGSRYNIRDKVGQKSEKNYNRFHSTFDIINALNSGWKPDVLMINTHPQRWTNNPFHWVTEYIVQNAKNSIKYLVAKYRRECAGENSSS